MKINKVIDICKSVNFNINTAIYGLIDNSLDAGATTIKLSFNNLDNIITSISIFDNGDGFDIDNSLIKNNIPKIGSYGVGLDIISNYLAESVNIYSNNKKINYFTKEVSEINNKKYSSGTTIILSSLKEKNNYSTVVRQIKDEVILKYLNYKPNIELIIEDCEKCESEVINFDIKINNELINKSVIELYSKENELLTIITKIEDTSLQDGKYGKVIDTDDIKIFDDYDRIKEEYKFIDTINIGLYETNEHDDIDNYGPVIIFRNNRCVGSKLSYNYSKVSQDILFVINYSSNEVDKYIGTQFDKNNYGIVSNSELKETLCFLQKILERKVNFSGNGDNSSIDSDYELSECDTESESDCDNNIEMIKNLLRSITDNNIKSSSSSENDVSASDDSGDDTSNIELKFTDSDLEKIINDSDNNDSDNNDSDNNDSDNNDSDNDSDNNDSDNNDSDNNDSDNNDSDNNDSDNNDSDNIIIMTQIIMTQIIMTQIIMTQIIMTQIIMTRIMIKT